MAPTTAGRCDDPDDPIGAAARGELSLHYQPILHATTRGIAGFEALLRWNHRTRGPLDAAAFAPVLERSRRGARLDRWILLAACRTAARWPASTHVAVNVFPPRLLRKEFVDDVRFALQVSGIDPHRLRIELVERAIVPCHPSATRSVHLLHDLGVALALDDFLQGASTIDQLASIPADIVKLDRAVVGPLNRGLRSPIAESIVATAHDLGVRVVAEGIETHQGEAAAIGLGCELLQGFLYSPAVPASQTDALLRAFPPPDLP